MENAISFLQKRVDETGTELAKVTKDKSALIERELTLIKDLAYYRGVLEAENRRNGKIPQPPTPAPPSSVLVVSENGNKKNVTEVIRDFIRESGTAGVTQKQIREYLAENHIQTHKNYPYVVVGKLKEEGSVRTRYGKLVWQDSPSKVSA